MSESVPSDSDGSGPPTVGRSGAGTGADAVEETGDGPLLEAAIEPEYSSSDPEGLSLRSPVVFWTLWALVVAAAVAVANTTLSVFDKRRRTSR